MPPLFRNNSPGALTRKQATALMKERLSAQNGGGAGHDVSNEPRVPKMRAANGRRLDRRRRLSRGPKAVLRRAAIL